MPAHRSEQTLESLARFSNSKVCFETTGVMGSFEQPGTGEYVWTPLHEQTGPQKNTATSLDNIRQCFFGTGSQGGSTVLLGVREDAASVRNTAFMFDWCLHDNSTENSTSLSSNIRNTGTQQERNVETMENETTETIARPREHHDSLKCSPLVIDVESDRNFVGEEDAEEIMAASVLTSLSLSPVLTEFAAFASNGNGFEDGVFGGDETGMELSRNNRRGRHRQQQKNSSKMVFQCTWPRCGKIVSNFTAIIWHVRSSHLGPKDKDDNGFSDGEEEFYFNEIELNTDGDMFRHSSEGSISPPYPQSRRNRSMSDPSPHTQPLLFTTTARAHTDDNCVRPVRSTSGNRWKPKRAPHQSAQTNSRKGRGDGRKCRKVYGMENRHLWCTQCRWKKACIKFVD